MIPRRPEAVGTELGADFLRDAPGNTIYDAAFAFVPFQDPQQRLVFLCRPFDDPPEILPVKAGDQLQRLPEPQQSADVIPHRLRRGRGERRNDRTPRQLIQKLRDLQISRTEILSPL